MIRKSKEFKDAEEGQPPGRLYEVPPRPTDYTEKTLVISILTESTSPATIPPTSAASTVKGLRVIAPSSSALQEVALTLLGVLHELKPRNRAANGLCPLRKPHPSSVLNNLY